MATSIVPQPILSDNGQSPAQSAHVPDTKNQIEVTPIKAHTVVTIRLYTYPDGHPAHYLKVTGKMPRAKAIRQAMFALLQNMED